MSYFGIPIRNGLPIGLGSVAPLGTNNSFFSPASFFANGEQGWWYDPSNFSTLFQDSAGTTPVTAMEQPVGLQLDLSKGAPATGPELVVNGDFSSGTGWTLGTGWSISGGQLVATLVNSESATQAIAALTTNNRYVVTFTVTVTLGTLKVFLGNIGDSAVERTITTSGTYTYRPSQSGTKQIAFFGQSSFTGSINNVSVKELPGNHRFQTTSANRPVVSARVNLLTKTEEFDNAAWTKSNVTVTANAIVAPDGTMTADSLIENTAISTHDLRQTVSLVAAASTFAIRAKPNGRTWIAVAVGSIRYAYFNLAGAGAVGFSLNATGAISVDANGWYTCTITFTPAAAGGDNAYVYLASADNVVTYTGDGTSGIYVWGADLRPTNQGVGLPAYQRVNTSTDYDSTGFPIYIKPNGSNQFMQTNSINFTATDKMTLWQGVRKLSDAAIGVICESSVLADNSNPGAFFIAHTNAPNYLFGVNGTTTASYTATTYAAPITNVLTSSMNIAGASIATELIPRVNGLTPTLNPSGGAGTGNFGNYPAYFYSRAGTSLFFGGNDYGSIARGAASTAAQITAGETYINSKTKAY